MKKILLAVGLVMASMSWANASTNNSNDVVVVGNGTGSVQVSQCASAWTCNNSSLNVSFEGDVDKVYVDGKATVIKGKDGKDGINGTNGKDGAQGIQGEKGDKGDTGATGAAGKDGINGTNGKDGVNGLDGKDGKDGLNGTNGTNGRDGIDGKDGAQGIQGEKGDKGETGAAGKDGLNGENGKDGAKGDKGDEGKQGIAGINGLNGKDADMTQVNANTEANKSISKRQDAFEKSTNQRFANMDKRIDENRKNASAGIAGVAAMANIPQVSQNSSFSVGAGVGSYDGEQGIAVGASARFNQNVVTKASVAGTTQNDFVFGAGVSYEW
ncbi:tail protein [Salmonella phage vB_SalP_TR2]|uniref:Agglutinating adhesin n=1 Tax=Salmonella phage vB_SalP_TR2 TaxID=2812854 RepID=A0A898KBA5_9CAUD|nr:tail protein [Salmonella phage vB_SalP_TR2]QSJ04000.1 agglutinating adhesin [Salmonella phage vB_SalP_TR2]